MKGLRARLNVRAMLYWLVWLFIWTPLVAEAQSTSQRGLPMRFDQYPLTSLHLSWPATPLRLRPRPGYELQFSGHWANTYAARDHYRVDAETGEFRLSGSVSTSSWEFGLSVPVLVRGGGVLDPLIDGWHDFFGLPDGGRDDVRDNQFEIAGTRTSGQPFGFEEQGGGIGNALVHVRRTLARSQRSAFAVDGVVSLPTASHEYGHDGLDVGVGFSASRALGGFVFSAGAAAIAASDSTVASVPFRNGWVEAYLVAEYPLQSLSIVAALQGATQKIRGIEDHPDHSIYLDAGTVIELERNTLLDLLIRENPSEGRGTADVSFLAVLRMHFD